MHTRSQSVIETEAPQVTSLEVHRDAAGQARLRTRCGPIAARVTGGGSYGLEVALVATVATLLGGDDLRLTVEIDDGLELILTDIAATVAYDGRGRQARWSAHVLLGDGARLTWRTQPLIVSDGARVLRTFTASLGPTAGLAIDETIVLGRHGERGGRLDSRMRVDLGGEPLLYENVTYDGADPAQRLIRGDAGTIMTRAAFGQARLEPHPADDVLLELAGPGRIARRLVAR